MELNIHVQIKFTLFSRSFQLTDIAKTVSLKSYHFSLHRRQFCTIPSTVNVCRLHILATYSSQRDMYSTLYNNKHVMWVTRYN